MTDLEEEPEEAPKEDQTKLPSEIEADIALYWSDNAAAAQMTRTVARAMLKQDVDAEKVREIIRNSGRVVE